MATKRSARTRSLTGAVSTSAKTALVIALAILIIAPLVLVQVTALSNGAEAYRKVIELPGLWRTLQNTLILGLGSAAIATVLGALLAWSSIRLPRRLLWLGVVPILPIVLPAVASVTGWAFLLSPTVGYVNQLLRMLPFFSGDSGPINVYSPLWITIITGLSLTSFVYVFVRSGLQRLNYELVEAAQASGCGPTKTFFSVILPLLRPSLVYGAATALLLGFGQLTAPLLLGQRENIRVISTEILSAVSEYVDYPLAAALASPLLICGILVFVAQRALLKRQERFATQSGKSGRGVGRPSNWAALAPILFGVVAIVLPLVALFVVALSPFWSENVNVSAFSLAHFAELFARPGVLDAIRNSIVYSIVGVLVALPVGYVIADMLYRQSTPGPVRAVVDLIAQLPLGVPAVVFGAGFLFLFTTRPIMLYGTPWALILVYVALTLPFTVRLQLAARISIGRPYEEAARVSGARPWLVHMRIMLPLVRPAMAGAAALMFVILSHEFTASMFVRSLNTQVMGTILFDIWQSGSYGQTAAMALVMWIVTSTGVLLAMLFGGGLSALDKL